MATVSLRLWRRRWCLVFLVFLVILPAFAMTMTGYPGGIWEPFMWWSRPYSLTIFGTYGHTPRMDIVLILLAFAFCWFRSCLRDKLEFPRNGSAGIRPVDLAWPLFEFLVYATGLLIAVVAVLFLGMYMGTYAFALFFNANMDFGDALFRQTNAVTFLVVRFTDVFIPLLPLVLLAHWIGRLALVLPAAACGRMISFSDSWNRSRAAWSPFDAISTALILAVLIALPINRLAIQIAMFGDLDIGGSAFNKSAFVFQLAKGVIAVAILVELLSDRYLQTGAGSRTGGKVAASGD